MSTNGSEQKAMQWTMGEQPDWIGVEEKGELPDGLLEQVLAENTWESLIKRGELKTPEGDK